MESVRDGLLDISHQSLEACDIQQFENSRRIAQFIDMSHNQLSDASFLQGFTVLKTINGDYNQFTTLNTFPALPQLDTLSLIQNQIEDLDQVILQIKRKFPKIENLSLIKNPCCPFMAQGYSDQEAYEYRLKLIQEIPSIKILDGSNITRQEILDAMSQKNQKAGRYFEEVKSLAYSDIAPKTPSRSTVIVTTEIKRVKKGISEGNRFIKNEDL